MSRGRSMGPILAILACIILAITLCTRNAAAQGDDPAEALPEEPRPTSIMYDTTYDRDVSSGTWSQLLSYGLTRGRMSLSASGGYTSIDFTRSPGLGGESGTLGGDLSFRASKNWVVGLNGTFNRVVSRDLVSETSQRQNRLKISGQYNANPWRTLRLAGTLSSELQRDHGLTVRPLGQERLDSIPRYDALGAQVGFDSIFVHDQRDSTFMFGRQDGASAQMTWKPKSWLQVVSDATGTRVRPTTTSALRDFARALDGSPVEVVNRDRFQSPNQTETYHARMTFSRIRRVMTWMDVRGLHNTLQYFDKSLRGQEELSVDQRGRVIHAEYAPMVGAQISVDGTANRSQSGYTLRKNRSSLVTSRSFQTAMSYSPSPRSRAAAVLNLDRKKNERQSSGNGINISRFLQVNGSHRLSSRLSLDGAGTVSLTSFQYVDSTLDQDNLRTYLNVGGGYAVSERCSTLVHFSASRGHTIAIDASRSGNNNTQSTYQMDASLRLGVTSTLSIVQSYLLNAVYQIYDDAQAESRNVLSRIRRIDTTVIDSIFNFAAVQVIHNFLFRDSGSFTQPPGGGAREYDVATETYQQTLGATLIIKPAPGIQVSATQSLGNTKIYFARTNSRVVDNRWNLTIGATMERNIMGGASLRGSAQHIGAYTERRNPGDPLAEQDDWIAGVTLHKEF